MQAFLRISTQLSAKIFLHTPKHALTALVRNMFLRICCPAGKKDKPVTIHHLRLTIHNYLYRHATGIIPGKAYSIQ